VGNELEDLYSAIDQSAESIQTFLQNAGIKQEEITVSTPSIVDKSAQQYGNESTLLFRYTASQSVTVYSENIKAVRTVMGKLSESQGQFSISPRDKNNPHIKQIRVVSTISYFLSD
jgi:hypothetical protein